MGKLLTPAALAPTVANTRPSERCISTYPVPMPSLEEIVLSECHSLGDSELLGLLMVGRLGV